MKWRRIHRFWQKSLQESKWVLAILNKILLCSAVASHMVYCTTSSVFLVILVDKEVIENIIAINFECPTAQTMTCTGVTIQPVSVPRHYHPRE